MITDEERKYLLEQAKEVKFKKGSILDKETVEKNLQRAKNLSDDDLLLNMMETFGRLAFMCYDKEQKIMGIYGLAVAYFIMENEALQRNLYF